MSDLLERVLVGLVVLVAVLGFWLMGESAWFMDQDSAWVRLEGFVPFAIGLVAIFGAIKIVLIWWPDKDSR